MKVQVSVDDIRRALIYVWVVGFAVSICAVPSFNDGDVNDADGLIADGTGRLVMALMALAAASMLLLLSVRKTADGSDETGFKYLMYTVFALYPFVIVDEIFGVWYAVGAVVLWASLMTLLLLLLHRKLKRV